MTVIDTTAPSQIDTIAFEFELNHAPEKVWRALTEPELLSEWLLPVVKLKLERGGGVHAQGARQARMGWHSRLPVRRDRGGAEAELHVGCRRLHRHGRHVHPDA